MTENCLNDEKIAAQMRGLEENLKEVRERIAQAAVKSGRRPEDITLLAATKTVSPQVINRAIELGIGHIGENRVQELMEKYDALNLSNCSCQFIGHLQTNKVKYLIGKVSLIQSVDSLKLASEISSQSLKKGAHTDLLIEVNIGGEESKSGVSPRKASRAFRSDRRAARRFDPRIDVYSARMRFSGGNYALFLENAGIFC